MAPKKKDTKGKKEKTKKPEKKLYALYDVQGDKVTKKTKMCPKCGSFLGKHKDRYACGKCKYTEKI